MTEEQQKQRMALTREGLLEKLNACQQSSDTEMAHGEADDLLIEYINDPDIAEAYHKIKKWYA